MDSIFGLFSFLCLMTVGYLVGSYNEQSHFKTIVKREKALIEKPTISFSKKVNLENAIEGRLVCGSVVVSVDFFKRFVASLIAIFGGRIVCYETLLDRARREATLRMQEKAIDCDMIINYRLETTIIGSKDNNGNKKASSIAAYAYGTAVKVSK